MIITKPRTAARDNERSADALVARLEQLDATCARLDRENSELRALVLSCAMPLPGSGGAAGRASCAVAAETGVDPRAGGAVPVSRRSVLGKALGAATAGVIGATALDATPAAAANGSPVSAGNTTMAESPTIVSYDGAGSFSGVILLGNDSTHSGSSADYPAALGGWAGAAGSGTAGTAGVANGIYGFTDNGAGYGVVGKNSAADLSSGGAGVYGTGGGLSPGVLGDNGVGTDVVFGVHGRLTNATPYYSAAAVRGESVGTSGIGVWGSVNGPGWGVYATSAGGIGVLAHGGAGTGVVADGAIGVLASGTATGLEASGPVAVNASGSTAVQAVSSSPTGIAVHASSGSSKAVVLATNSAAGPAVQGIGHTGPGGMFFGATGVTASGSGASGRGGAFSGTAAQVHLKPGGTSHPKSGSRGDLYADSTGRLWFCKTSGTTATWHQIA